MGFDTKVIAQVKEGSNHASFTHPERGFLFYGVHIYRYWVFDGHGFAFATIVYNNACMDFREFF